MSDLVSEAAGRAVRLKGHSPGAILVRRLLPVTVGLPILVGLLRLEGERAGLYSATVGVLIMIGFGVVGATGLLIWTAASLERLDRDRRRAEDAVRRAHEQHRALARNFPDGAIVLFDRDLRHLIADGAGLASVGLSAATVEGKTIWEVFPTEVCAAIEPPYRAALKGSESTFEYGYRDRTYLVRVVPVRDEPAGTAWGGAVIVRDISARKREEEEMRAAEARIRQSEARLAEAQKLAQLGSWEWDPHADTAVWSDELYRIYGLEPGSPQPSFASFRERIHPDDHSRVEQTVEHARESAEPFTLEYRIVRPDGTVRWLQGHGEAALDEQGRRSMRGTAQDITERKRADQDRDRLQAELHQAQKLEAIGQLASGVAHEFNNTLMAITGHSSLLLQRIEPGPLRRDVEQIVGAAERAGNLTRQLLAFGRKQVLNPCTIQLNDVVSATVSLLRPLIEPRVALLTKLDPELPTTAADPAQIEQVIVNLVLNARDAITDRGTIAITTAAVDVDAQTARRESVEPGRYLSLSVSDDGCGMDGATRARIFEPFFTTKEPGAGSGLGLSTAFGIVRQGGGFLTVESEPGHGTAMTLCLPADTEAAAGNKAVGQAVNSACGEPNHSKGRAIVVDDDPSVRHVCAELLEQIGFDVQTASDGEQALQLLEREKARIELLLTDIVMPGIRGRELARHAAELHPEAVIVYMSGYPGDQHADADCNDADRLFIQKPFTGAQLETLLSAALPAEIDRDGHELSCVVADDHPSVLDAICRVLEQDEIRVVARAADASDALAQVKRHAPDVALLDVAMPGLGGVEATKQVRESSPATRIVLYTGHGERELVADALAAGAHALVLKSAPLAELAKAIKIAAEGGIYIDQSLAGVLLPNETMTRPENGPKLTDREHEVLRLLADGNTNEQVAKTLTISADTVQTHVRNAMKKLRADTRTQAVATAMRQSLIQ